MKRILQSLVLAIAIIVMQILGRVLSFDVARWFSSDEGLVHMGRGFYFVFYVVFYAVPIYALLWWAGRETKK
jgi:hypothetical protein